MDVGHKEQRNDHSEPNNRLIVNNLKFETDENGLRDYFSKFGQVVSVEIPLSQNKSRGFGFVTFSTVEEATKANDPNVTHEINERQVRTSFAKKRENVVREERKVRKLYIGKLPKEINEEELKQYFGQFGKVEETILSTFQFAPLLNGYPQHRGYGFVKFESDEDASKAVKQKEHVIKGTSIFLKKAVDDKPKDRKNKNNNDRKNNDRKNNNNNNKGGNRERRNNKEGGNNNNKEKTQSPSTNTSPSTTTQSTTTATTSPSTTTTTESGSQEKKSVVVKRKEDSPSTTNTTNSKQSTPKTDNRRQQSSNNNNNKSNNTQTTTKKAVIIQKTSSSTVNPWKTNTTTTPTETQASNEYPTLGGSKKKTNNNTKKSPTTTTTVDNGKEDKEDK